MNRDGPARLHERQVERRPAAVVAVRHVQARSSVSTANRRHVVRTTSSAAILLMLYVGIITRWLSPSGSLSNWGRHRRPRTPRSRNSAETRAPAAVRHQESRGLCVAREIDIPAAALDDREVAHVVDAGRHVVERPARSAGGTRHARSTRAGRGSRASLNRATAMTSCSFASASATGKPTWPVAGDEMREPGAIMLPPAPCGDRPPASWPRSASARSWRCREAAAASIEAAVGGEAPATACTKCSSVRSTSTSPLRTWCGRRAPRSRCRPSALSAKRRSACHAIRAAASAGQGHLDVVGVGRQLEREVKACRRAG